MGKDSDGPGTAADIEDTPGSSSRIVVLVVLIVVVGITVLIAHWPVLSTRAMMFDDETLVFKSPLIQNPSVQSAGRILGEVLEPSLGGYYKPLSMISLMVDRAIAGDPQQVRQFRRTSLALHIGSTALVVVLLYLLFGEPWVAAMVGLLFGLHPTAVEAIAWTAERKNLLGAFFALCCLVAYVRYARRPGWGFYSAALAMYVLALLSKPTATPVALLLLLLDYWPLGRLNRRAILEKVPFLVMGAASAVITVISQQRTIGIVAPSDRPALHTLLVVGHNLIFYLGKALWPGNLTAHYPHPEPFDLSNPWLLGALVGSVVLVVAVLISWRWTRVLPAGGLFFLLAISPAIGVIGFQSAIAADRFLYLPSVGLLLILAWCLGHIWRRTAGKPHPKAGRALMVLLVVLVASAEARATRRYLAYWRDSETLDRYMVGMAPSSADLHTKLGNTLRSQGRLADAVQAYWQALSFRPDMFNAHHNLAIVLQKQGKIEEAIQHCRAAVRSEPGHLFAHRAHNSLGGCLLELGRIDEAVEQFRAALRLKPDYANAHLGLGLALLRGQNLEEAGMQFVAALALSPDHAGARYNLGKVLSAQGRLEEAVDQYRLALPLAPDAPELHNNLAVVLVRLGKIDEAIAQYREVLRIEPGNTLARHALATLLARRGRYAESADAYRAVLAIDSNDVDAHFGLGCALSVRGKADQATAEFREALRIDPQHAGARQGLAALSSAADKP